MSIAAAAQRIGNEYGQLDVLVNNAGISHTDIGDEAPSDASLQQIVQAGRMSVAPWPRSVRSSTSMFRRDRRHPGDAPAPTPGTRSRIVNVASSGGSLTLNSDPSNPTAHVRDLLRLQGRPQRTHGRVRRRSRSRRHQGELGLSGFTATDLNFFRGTRTVEQAASEPVRLALIGADGPTGTFSNEDGPIPW